MKQNTGGFSMPTVTCNCGQHTVNVDCEGLDWESDSHEKSPEGMGVETHHYATFNATCPKCNTAISVTFECWEYPEGVIETTDVEPQNCTVDEHCCPEITGQ